MFILGLIAAYLLGMFLGYEIGSAPEIDFDEDRYIGEDDYYEGERHTVED